MALEQAYFPLWPQVAVLEMFEMLAPPQKLPDPSHVVAQQLAMQLAEMQQVALQLAAILE